MIFYGKQIIKMLAEHCLFPLTYRVACRKPVRARTVVFADAHRTELPASMERLHAALIDRGYTVTDFFFNLKELSAAEGMKRMLAFMKLYAQTETVIIQDNFLPVSSCRKRAGTLVIQLWHGCGAFKKFGYDATDDIPRFYIGNVYKNYDLVTVSSPYCRRFFASAMRVRRPSVVRALGSPYTDCYYDSSYRAEMLRRFEMHYGKKDGRTVIVWAPTFRGNAGRQDTDGGHQTVGEAWIDELAQDERYLVIKSLHPHMLKKEARAGLTTGELLFAADLLITDYSSVLFEYLLLDRPVVFFAPDLAAYREKRGWYISYEELPGAVVTDGQILTQTVAQALEADTFRQKREQFRERFMSRCDGHATERILKAMEQVCKTRRKIETNRGETDVEKSV